MAIDSGAAAAVAATPFIIPAQPNYSVQALHTFADGTDGLEPATTLVSDGVKLYGTAEFGGSGGQGIVFSMNTDGSNFTVLHSFGGSDGSEVDGPLTLVNSTLYGTTELGGDNHDGTVFSLATDGSGFKVLHSFNSGGGEGSRPKGGVIVVNSALYGTTQFGGANSDGTLFSIGTDGSNFATLHSFAGGVSDGAVPMGTLATDGTSVFGTTDSGGASGINSGTIFSYNTSSSTYKVLYSLNGASDGSSPEAGLTLSGGVLYGATISNGANFNGTIFSIGVGGDGFQVLHSFADNNSVQATAALTAIGGVLYGTTQFGGSGDDGTVFSLNNDGTNFQTLYSFADSDGSHPEAGITSIGGKLFGATSAGGANGDGTIFSLVPIPVLGAPSVTDTATAMNTPSSSGLVISPNAGDIGELSGYTITNIVGGSLFLHDGITPIANGSRISTAQGAAGLVFAPTINSTSPGSFAVAEVPNVSGGVNGPTTLAHVVVNPYVLKTERTFAGGTSDGATPSSELLQVGSMFYGTTLLGGTGSLGALFSVNQDGTNFHLLHSFAGGPGDSEFPDGALAIVGTTIYGTAEGNGTSDDGIIFSYDTATSTYQVVHTFTGGTTDGNDPTGGLVASGTTLYGATAKGGANNLGSVYSIDASGQNFQLLHSFSGAASGGARIGVVSGTALYGTIAGQNTAGNFGSVFSIGTDGQNFQTLHTFNSTDGSSPVGALILSGSVLYGTTRQGGTFDDGTIYSVGTGGSTFLSLQSFDGGESDGGSPLAGLTLQNGRLIGTTSTGGSFGHGIVFSVGTLGSNFKTLYTFTSTYLPDSALDPIGSVFYGMSSQGGSGNGTLFAIAPQPAILHAPLVTGANTTENIETNSGLTITPDPLDINVVTSFQISGITGGQLFQHDGTTPIQNGDFITAAQGAAGLRFLPTLNSNSPGSFAVQESSTGDATGLGGSIAIATIHVNPVLVGPIITNSITAMNIQSSSGLVILPSAVDAPFVTNFQVSNIQGGSLFQQDGVTPIHNGDFITTAQGAAGLRFTPIVNSTTTGSFSVQESTTADLTGLGGQTATAVVTVSPLSLQTIHSFSQSLTDGASPSSGLLVYNSKFYGTTTIGGSANDGLLFSMNLDGSGFTPLHSFVGGDNDGISPNGSLIVINNVLYGTTQGGGTAGVGTVYSFNLGTNDFQLLHSFTGSSTDGNAPQSGLVAIGNTLFGTTLTGGADLTGVGTIYSINTDGSNFQVLHSFDGETESDSPIGGLITDGTTLYGVAAGTSVNNLASLGVSDNGSVFSIRPDGTDFTVLHKFKNTDGSYPDATLLLIGSSLYGTTRQGNSSGNGIVFSINLNAPVSSNFKTLVSFTGGANDGGGLMGGLTQVGSLLFGTTFKGGAHGAGTVFSINTNGGGFRDAYDFTQQGFSNSTLYLIGSTLYGTTIDGGANNQGSIFALSAAAPTLHAPMVTNASTAQNAQTTSGLVITPNATDIGVVTHFQINNINGGTLFLNDGTTPIAAGSFITAAQGAAGLKFTPFNNSTATGSFTAQESTTGDAIGLGGLAVKGTITINPVLHTASVTNTSTTQNTQTTSGLVITPNSADTAVVNSFKITGITGGSLFQHDGNSPITSDSFITLAQAAAGLRFTPANNSLAPGSFSVQESTNTGNSGLGGSPATATITVSLGPDAANVTGATTLENTQTTSGLVITPNPADANVKDFQITNITGGSLFQHDGTTPIANGTFITLAQAAAGLTFTPTTNFLSPGAGFTVQQSTSATAAGLIGLTTTTTINVLSPWQNPAQTLDVSNDGKVSAIDALLIINAINHGTFGLLPPVTPGNSPPPYYDTNNDGKITAADALKVINFLNSAHGGPVIQVSLLNDTAPGGGTNNDLVTSDPTMVGQITDPGGQNTLLSATATLDGFSTTINLLPSLTPSGNFRITSAQLNQLAGGTLSNGLHTLTIRAKDELGYSPTKLFLFTLDTVAPAPTAPVLDPGSDSGAQGDNLTNVTTPAFQVNAPAGTMVTLYVDGNSAATAPAGQLLTAPKLSDGVHTIQASIVDAAGSASGLSPGLNVRIDTTPPTLNLSMLSITSDTTPNFTLTTSGAIPLPNGTSFHIDVDLNNDGTFSSDELDNTVATLFNGQQQMQLAKALPTGEVGIRARLVDAAGNVALSPVQEVFIDTDTSSVLKDYVNAPDPAFAFPLVSTIQGPGYTAYILHLTSQTWLQPEDFVNGVGYTWQHYMSVIVPNGAVSSTALLLVDGGSNTDTAPTSSDFGNGTPLGELAQEAVASHSVAVDLPDVPNEPITFVGDPAGIVGRSEDQIIAYTFSKFLEDPQNNTDWLVLLPMVNSAVKGMDATQQFVSNQTGGADQITHFVVTGGSKRGWTTWLTAAVDSRVVAIAPEVFDALNLGEQMVHQYGAYGFFSPAVKPYQDEQIFDRLLTPAGLELGQIVDPYSYLSDGNLNIPKLEIDSTGDQFFLGDSMQYYHQDLPGTQNYIYFAPNTDHSGITNDPNTVLDLEVFYDSIINNIALPQFSWQVLDNGTIKVQTTTQPFSVELWQATNPTARDFRLDFTDPTIVHWTSTNLTSQGNGVYLGSVPTPATGATAYYVELDFSSPFGIPYRFTTEMRVATNLPLYAWPYQTGPVLAPPPAGSSVLVGTSGDVGASNDGDLSTQEFVLSQLGNAAFAATVTPSASASGLPNPPSGQTQAGSINPVSAPATTQSASTPSASATNAAPTVMPASSVRAGSSTSGAQATQDLFSAVLDEQMDDLVSSLLD